MGDSLKTKFEVDLRSIAAELLTRSRNFERTNSPSLDRWSQGLAQFQTLQVLISESLRTLEQQAQPIPQTAPPRPSRVVGRRASSRLEPEPRPARRPEDYVTHQKAYVPALQDADVIQALLDLHEQVQVEQARSRDAALNTSVAQAQARALPKIDTTSEQMRFSRANQSPGGVFSPILKPSGNKTGSP